MDFILIYLLSWAIFLLIIGYILPSIRNKIIARISAWAIILSTTFFSILITADQTALYRMAAICSLQLISMKTIVMVETYSGKPKLNIIQWLCFAGGWFGMRPVLFETLLTKSSYKATPLLFKSISRIILGMALLMGSHLVEENYYHSFYTSDLLMYAGMSFILHFGILNLSTVLWRSLGVDVIELFLEPARSRSLKEFWGKRWNMAFSEMTALIIYKPLVGKYGKNTAMLSAFLVSGILHEIAISFPVGIGYGFPLLFFVIHGIGMTAENMSPFVKKIIEHKFLSHFWVFAWLLVPMPLLFHSGFTDLVAKPLRYFLLSIIGVL
ncbi:MAG: membrane bound O-acyl transferase family-domain-containing protein [Saprospiraceae bacterium]|nr:membrane bound O-acyl transferase family-domain-containing protein [Saprospiraceae bacterium]